MLGSVQCSPDSEIQEEALISTLLHCSTQQRRFDGFSKPQHGASGIREDISAKNGQSKHAEISCTAHIVCVQNLTFLKSAMNDRMETGGKAFAVHTVVEAVARQITHVSLKGFNTKGVPGQR